MNARRDVSERDRALKALFRELVKRVGGLDAAAACCRVGRSQLASYQDMGSEAFAPIDVVAALEEVAGEPLVTAELARRAGHALTQRRPIEPKRLAKLVARLARESGDVLASYASGIDDGKLCRDDLADLARELGDLERAAAEALGAVHLKIGALG